MSADDLVSWATALRAGKVLKEESLRLWAEPGPGGFGLGWFCSVGAAGLRLHHPGATEGYRAWFSVWPERNCCVVVLSDERQDVDQLGAALEACLFPISASNTGVQVAAADATTDGYVLEPGAAWGWIATSAEQSLHARWRSSRTGPRSRSSWPR